MPEQDLICAIHGTEGSDCPECEAEVLAVLDDLFPSPRDQKLLSDPAAPRQPKRFAVVFETSVPERFSGDGWRPSSVRVGQTVVLADTVAEARSYATDATEFPIRILDVRPAPYDPRRGDEHLPDARI